MNKPFGSIFGGAIAAILLLIFVIATWTMIFSVISACKGLAACGKVYDFGEGYRNVVTTVGGLVAALVIAQLSVTEPGGAPRLGHFTPTSDGGVWWTNFLVFGYLGAWMLTGVSALVVGVMLYPKGSTTVSDIGSTWLGLAVSAAYAYFGIRPSQDGLAVREPASSVVVELKKLISEKKIVFDALERASLERQLLGTASGVSATPKLQSLVLSLSKMATLIKINSIVSPDGPHNSGRAVHIESGPLTKALLSELAVEFKVVQFNIDEIIFDAAKIEQNDRNIWNFKGGKKHVYTDEILSAHKENVHISVFE